MVQITPHVSWNQAFQLFFDFPGCFRICFDQPDAMRYPKDVRIDGKGLRAESGCSHYLGRLLSNAGKSDQRLDRTRYFAAVFGNNHSAESYEVARLAVGIRYRFDEGKQLFRRCFRHLSYGRKRIKERRRNLIHAFVRALR